MHAPRLVLVALVPACSLYLDSPALGPPLVEYDLVPTRTMAGEREIVGVDSDRAGGLWVLYRSLPSDVWVTHLDPALEKLSEWHLTGDPVPVLGLAYTGESVWLNYWSRAPDGADHVRVLDALTGVPVQTFATPEGIVDLEEIDGDIAASNTWNEVTGMDPQNGGVMWHATIASTDFSTQGGLAYDGERLWIASWASQGTIFLVDQQGVLLGKAYTDLIDGTVVASFPLAWDGERLLLVVDNQITWLEPRPH